MDDITTHRQAGLLMGVVRECFYVPDSRCPDGYDDGRDMSILRYWLDKGGDPDDIEAAIRGTALMRDRGELGYVEPDEKLTLRILNPKTSRYGQHQFRAGKTAWLKHQETEGRKADPDMERVGNDPLIEGMAAALRRAQMEAQ